MPIYRFNSKVYDIPDDVVKDFEKDRPTATIAYKNGEDIYDIQVNQREQFLKQFPEAELYDERANDITQVGGVTQAGDITQGSALTQGESTTDQAVPDAEIQRLKNIQSTAQQQIDNASFFDRFFDADTRAAVATRNKAEEALEVYDEANREKENWFDRNVVGAFKGFADKVGDLSTWDMGASGLASAKALNDAYTKWENGEKLTTAEQNMLDAYGLATAVQSAYQDKVGTAYNVGGSLPESLAFGASLAINPAGGVGKKLAESAAKAAVKKYGASFVSKLAKGAARVGGDVLEMGVATAVPGAGRVAEDYYNRLNGQSTFEIDDNGIIRYGGQQEQEEADDAIWKAFGSQFIENYSEAMGNYFAPMGSVLSNLTSKGLKAAHLGKLADVVNDISSSQFSKSLQRFKDATKFDGLVGEYLEEVAGNVMNAATVGDMNFNSPDDPRSVFNPETNIETFLSCALLSGTMYAVEAPISMYNKNVAKKNLTNADIAASKVWDKDRWDDLRSQMDEADPQLLAQLLTGVQNATDLNDEQKQVAKDYGMRLMQFQGYNARRMQNTSESTWDANEINNAYDDGADIQAPYDKHSAKVAADRAEASLGEDAEFNQAVISGAETPVATINAMAESGKYTEEQIQKAKDYYVAINRMNGMTDALLDEVDAKIESANVEVDMNTNKDLGQVIQVTLRDGSVGYVVQGSVNSSEDGSIDVNNSDDTIMVRLQNGEVKMMNPGKDLRGVTWAETPDALKDANNNQLRMNLIDQGIAEIDWNPNTPNPKVGDAYVVDGVPTTIVGEDGKGGLFVVPTEKWQEVQGNEIKMQQLVEQASQNPIPVASFKQWASDQLDAQEEAQMQQEQAETSSSEIPNNQEEMLPAEQPVATTEEGVAVKEESVQQVVPTKEDGSIDFVAYGIGNSLKELGNAYGEKMPHKVEVTAKAFADDLIKAQKAIEKAQEALDNAPIGRDAKQKESLEKARIAYEEVKKEADFWAEMDADIKKAQEERESLTNPKAELDLSDEPMTTEEFIAKALADGGIRLTADSYKKELGYGEKERKKFLKMFAKAENGGVSVERAGEWLMQWDRENGTNFFDQTDANAGRDALINFLGSVQTWGDITGYIRSNREYQAQRESEALKEEVETAIEQNYHMVPGDYATSKEVEAVENPFEGVDLEELDAIFALTLEEYYEYERNQSNEQGAEASIAEGSNDVLLEEQADNTGGIEQSERTRETGSDIPRIGTESGSAQADETRSRRFVNPFEAAERIDKEERRLRPIKHRLREWAAAGIVVNVVERVEDIPNRSVESAINGGSIVPGWYEVSNGQVYIYLPHVRSVKDLDETIIHEALSHKGIRNLIGEKRFGELCDKVWNSMPEDAKTEYSDYEGVRDIKDEKRKQRAAADEYMAHLAEQQNLSPQEKTIWDNIVMFFRDLLDKALNGILSKSEITDDDIAKLIRISYANLKSGAEGRLGDTGTRFSAKKKRALETASVSRGKHQPTVVSSADGANILKNLDNLQKEYEERTSNQSKTFIGDVARELKAEKDGSGSQYATFETINGKVVTIQLSDHNATVSNFDYRNEDEGISIVITAKENQNVINDGNAHIVEFFYDSIKLRRADGKPLAEIIKSLKQALYSGEFKDTTGLAEKEDVNPTMFRVVKDGEGNKTLVGLHNISEEKLRKAIKQGGLANPSMAVIDMDKQSHVDYGDITLIAPAELIDKNTGRSAGTYMGDAWTPTYPKVTMQLDNKGWKKINQYIESLVEDKDLQNNMKYGTEMYMEGESGMYMNFAFLKTKGLNPEIFYKNNEGYVSTDDIKKLLGVDEIDTSFEGYSKLNELPEEVLEELKLWARTYGNKSKINAYKERLEVIKNQYGEDSKAYKSMAKSSEKLGYGEFDRLVAETKRKERDNGTIDSNKTFNEANYYVAQNGLRQEFEKWMDELLLDAGAKEVFFAGYTPSGNKRYLPNTIENVSKYMNKQGKVNAYDDTGFGATKALFLKKLSTLEEIREQKDKLVDLEEYREKTKELSERMADLIGRLSDMKTISSNKFMNYDYAASRLQESMTKRNPIKYLNDAYGYDLDKKDSFAEDLTELIKDIKDSPARYFETKFERPVYLNEFAAAVVPQGTSKNVVDALTDAGLQIEEYESGNNEARMAAVDKVSSETEGVRFRFLGERGARNLDKAEEATTRLDNLAVAREMEAAEKDAKTIKMATGWERGADGLWRYEVDDNLKFDLSANVDYRKRHPEFTRFEDLRHKYGANLLEIGEPLTEEEQKEYESLEKEFGGNTELHRSRKLKDYVDAPELFEAYPELRNIDIEFIEMDKGTEGKYLPISKAIHLNENIKYTGQNVIGRVLAHEIQHAIQHIEGFEPGANKDMQNPNKVAQKAYNREFMQNQLDKHKAERDELLKEKDALNDKMAAWYDSHEENASFDDEMNEYNRQYDELESKLEEADRKVSWDEHWLETIKKAKTELGAEGYYKSSGEVEARNVMSRLGMTPEQRRESLASETEDVAREDQIFLKDGIETGIRFRRTYHGSGASFDKFDHSFMGTGEGNQSFGWGTYVTDVKGIGENYGTIALRGKDMFEYIGDQSVNRWVLADAKQMMDRAGGYDEMIKLYGNATLAPGTATEQAVNFLKSTKKEDWEGQRHLYEVEIPDDNGSNYIAWDKMLPKEQAERIKEAIRSSSFFKDYEKEYKRLAEERLDAWTKTNGGRAYKLLGNIVWNEKDLSQILSEAGFVGFKYPTNYMSGGNKEGTNNYVIFNEDDVQIVEHTRFRVTRQEAQKEVDNFTSKYNSKQVVVMDYAMSDKEKVDLFEDTASLEDVNELFSKGYKAGYNRKNGKIYIFADNETIEEIEEGLFHENIHADIVAYGDLQDKIWAELANTSNPMLARVQKHYNEDKWKEEFFVYTISEGQKKGDLASVMHVLSEEEQGKLLDLLNKNGYDYGKESKERNTGRQEEELLGRSSKEGGRIRTSGDRVSGDTGKSSKAKAERLRELFERVADMGLDGVLGNGEYTSLMADIYKVLPEDVRKEVDGNALRYYGGNVAPAVSDYIVADGKANILDKVVGFIKEALRKAGYDLDLTQHDVKYLLWRSKKPLKRYDALDVAEDIDARRSFGVDKEGGTRFRSSNAKPPFDPSDRRAKIVKEYDSFLKTGKFNFIEAFQDRMYSVKVFMDMIVKATGKKVRDFEDAYKAENQLGSINKPAEEKYLKNFYKPLVETIRELSGKYGREAIERYIYCKSGLERNEVLRQRDADEVYNDAKAELDDKLAKNQITQAQYNTLLQQAEAQRKQTLAEDVDYSGIRGMLYNMKAQAINKDYEEGRIDKATRDARLDNLEANKKAEVQDWKQFAENQVATIENQASSAELNALWKKINAATNETLRIDYESGMIDKATYDAEKAMMKYYVPLRNWADTTAEEMYEYRSELVRPVSSNQKRAKGRESQADNPIATIALMAQNAIVRGNRNKVKQKFYAFVANRETGLASVRDVWYVRDQNGDWVPQYADTTQAKDAAEFAQILQDFETDMQLLEAQGDAYKGKLPQGMKFRANRQQKMSHVVAVMINGKEYAVYMNGNPRPAQAINGETNSEAANASAWYDKLKRIYGAGLTSWNPDFIIPNMIRDGIHASTMTMIDAGPFAAARFALNGPKAFAQVFAMVSGVGKNLVNPRNQAYFEEFVANGGETGYTAINTLEDYKKEYDKLMKEVKGLKGKNLFKNGFEAIGKWLEAANRIFEDVNRFNAYVSARESGESIMRSVDAAKNITVNFNRKGALSANSSVFGTIANAMSKWILFFNPAVQGIAQLVTKTKMNPGRAIAMSGTILSSGFVMPMLNEILVAANGGDDEDDYWNQSDFKRRNNWMLFTGDGYVSVPLPPVLRELYGIGDIIYGSITGHITPERAAMDMARQVQSAIGFVNLIPEASQEPDMITWAKGFAPDLASPVLDVISNTNFMGRPIAKWTSFNEYDPEYERVYKGVSPLWVELSKLLNEVGGNEGRRSDVWGNFINPAMMEHLFNSYGGGIGKTINNLSGMIWDGIKGNTENLDPYRKSPILPRFYTPNDEKTVVPAINRKYYDYEYMFNTAKKALKNYQEGVKSKEHPEYQKYIDEMKENGEIQFIKFFEQESKRLKKIQNLIKGDPSNKKELEERMIDMKADIATKCYEMLN